MPVNTPSYPITEPFGKNATSTYIELPVPNASQIGIAAGRASFDDGFVPLNMTSPTAGGVPPFGKDINGVLFMLSQYAMLAQSGQLCVFDAGVAAAIGGYAKGAVLASVSTPGRLWRNNLAGNASDPDTTPANWISNTPLYATSAPTAGTHNDFVLPGASDFTLDLDTTAGAVNITGFVAQRDGQRLFVSCTGANLLQLMALNGGSAAANQIRNATDLGAVQDQTITLQYFSALSKWLLV